MLSDGFYTIKDAASLIAFGVIGMNDTKLRSLFKDTQRYEAAVSSDRAYDNGRIVDISFLDLMELRAISYFRKRGSTPQALRIAAQRAREKYGKHPFSRKDVVFHKQGRNLIGAAAEEAGDTQLLNLVNNQYEFDLVAEFFDEGVKWDANEQFPEYWYPDEHEFPDIAVDPRVSFGRPSVFSFGIETQTLYSAWVDCKGDYNAVADWFELPVEKVRSAIKFQTELPN